MAAVQGEVEGTGEAREAARQAAAGAGLRYVTDAGPGLRRRGRGKGFSYHREDGGRLEDARTLARIRSLAIPPAWSDVWISPDPRGHVQATGRDDRGRKQYRYHADWQARRGEDKYDRVLAFGRALPEIRRQTKAHMGGTPCGRRTVLATVVRLLETTLIRVGNARYARENRSYGLTTLRRRHVEVEGGAVTFEFVGKGGRKHLIELTDRRAARVIGQLQDLPGQELFQYVDRDGARHAIGSDEVNDYLRELAGEPFTAKDFRTWAGTVLAAWALSEFEEIDSEAAAKRNIRWAVERVATRLGNTPAVCRRSYVHPEILGAYLDGSLVGSLRDRIADRLRRDLSGLSPEEVAVFLLLQRRLEAASTAG
ncbi:MAG: DNA topoisomerase IB [Tistlia sp.]|uniref:DNA topoisomerase IB n=1 Tax=Tistlia sp. TaxID=3057121 RepID=UPI0034A54675